MTRYSRLPDIEAAPLQEETVLYLPALKKFCLLNRSAAFIWAELETPRTARELAARLQAVFSGADDAVAERDVSDTLRQLMDLGAVAAE